MNILLPNNKSLTDLERQATYVHSQDGSATPWVINHALHKYPSVFCVDNGGNQIVGELTYVNSQQVTIDFSEPISGKAYLN